MVTFDKAWTPLWFDFASSGDENGAAPSGLNYTRAFSGLDANTVEKNPDGSFRAIRGTGAYSQDFATVNVNPDGSANVGPWQHENLRTDLQAALQAGAIATAVFGGAAALTGGSIFGGAGAAAAVPAYTTAAADSALVGGAAYAGSVPAAVDLLGAGGLGVVDTGAAVMAAAPVSFDALRQSELATYASSPGAAVSPALPGDVLGPASADATKALGHVVDPQNEWIDKTLTTAASTAAKAGTGLLINQLMQPPARPPASASSAPAATAAPDGATTASLLIAGGALLLGLVIAHHSHKG